MDETPRFLLAKKKYKKYKKVLSKIARTNNNAH